MAPFILKEVYSMEKIANLPLPNEYYVNACVQNEFSDAVNVMMHATLESKPHSPRTYYRELEKALKSGTVAHNTEYFNKNAGIGPLEACKLQTPEITIAYQINANEERTQRLTLHGPGGKDIVNPHEIQRAIYVIGQDFLHDATMVTINKDGERLSHAPAYAAVMDRMMALQRLQNAIERAAVAARTLINYNDPTVRDSLKQAFATDGFVHSTVEKPFELECLQRIGAEMANTLDVTTMSKFRDIMATFDAKFDAIGEDVPPSERVAMAMSDTAAAVSASLPPKAANDLKAFCNSDTVRGIINETQAEVSARTESKEAGMLEENERQHADDEEEREDALDD